MKLLPDTNIFIEFWENQSDSADELRKVFETEEIIICGAVRAELLHGAVSEKHFKSMSAMLDAFEEVNPNDTDWQLLGKNLFLLRKNGITLPFADAIIATIAMQNNLTVWTHDKHFRLMKDVLDGLDINTQ